MNVDDILHLLLEPLSTHAVMAVAIIYLARKLDACEQRIIELIERLDTDLLNRRLDNS